MAEHFYGGQGVHYMRHADGRVTIDEFPQIEYVSRAFINHPEQELATLEETPDGDRLKIRCASGWADYAVVGRTRLEDEVLECQLMFCEYY